MLCVLSCKTWNVVKTGASVATPLFRASQQSQDLSLTLSMVLQVLHSQQVAIHNHSQLRQCPGRLEARSEACSALSLKPKQDYLISLTEERAFFPPQPCVVFLIHIRWEGFEALKEMFVKTTGSLKD